MKTLVTVEHRELYSVLVLSVRLLSLTTTDDSFSSGFTPSGALTAGKPAPDTDDNTWSR